MVLIKPILIFALVLAGGGIVLSLRSRLFVRIGVSTFLLSGCIFILFPDLANAVAHFVGVGRGADLWLYLQSLLSIFVGLRLYRRALAQERAIAEIARTVAIFAAKAPQIGGATGNNS